MGYTKDELKLRIDEQAAQIEKLKGQVKTVKALSAKVKDLTNYAENLELENEAVRLMTGHMASGIGALQQRINAAESELFTALQEWAGYDDDKDYWATPDVQAWVMWRMVDLAGSGTQYIEVLPAIPEEQRLTTIDALEKVFALDAEVISGDETEGPTRLLGEP